MEREFPADSDFHLLIVVSTWSNTAVSRYTGAVRRSVCFVISSDGGACNVMLYKHREPGPDNVPAYRAVNYIQTNDSLLKKVYYRFDIFV